MLNIGGVHERERPCGEVWRSLAEAVKGYECYGEWMRREPNMTDSYLYGEWAEEEFSTTGVPELKPLSPGPGDWVVGGTEVRENEVIILAGNLIVESGGNLTLINCTLYMNCTYDGEWQIRVERGGIMNVLKGSVITAYNPDYEFLFYVYGRLIMQDSFLSRCGYNYGHPGLLLRTDEGVMIKSCTITKCYCAIYSTYASSIAIVDCEVSQNDWCGICCRYSSNIIIKNNTFLRNGILLDGWALSHFASHTIEDNTVNGRPLYYIVNVTGPLNVPSNVGQIIIANSTRIKLISANLSCTDIGLEVAYAKDIHVERCLISQNHWDGILCLHSSGITVMNCQIRDNIRFGVELRWSTSFIIMDNIFINNSMNLFGGDVAHYIHTIENNTVNDRPLYYLLNAHDYVIPHAVGSVIVVNSTSIIAKDLDQIRIEFDWSNNITIYDCVAEIDLDHTTNAQIINCCFVRMLDASESRGISICECVGQNKFEGILCWYSSNITISDCTISQGYWLGISCGHSSNITITDCTVTRNDVGVYIHDSSNVSIHYCNIYGNRGHGLFVGGGHVVNATHNWWGSPDGPEYKAKGDPEDPEEVYGDVIYEPWLTEPVTIDTKPTPLTVTVVLSPFSLILIGSVLIGSILIAVPVRYWKAERSRSEKLLKLVKRKRQYRFGIDYLVSKTGLDERKVERLLTKLLKNGQLTGILDKEAGTFIYIPRHKIETIFSLIDSRGVVSLRELASKFSLTERELKLLIISMRRG